RAIVARVGGVVAVVIAGAVGVVVGAVGSATVCRARRVVGVACCVVRAVLTVVSGVVAGGALGGGLLGAIAAPAAGVGRPAEDAAGPDRPRGRRGCPGRGDRCGRRLVVLR